MKAIFLSLLLGFEFLALPAWATKEVGNGGDAIVCRRKEKVQRVQFYDLYETEVIAKLGKPDTGGDQLGLDQKVNLLLSRIEKINPNRAQLYRNWYKTFFNPNELEFVTGVELVDVPDTGHGYYPRGCKLEQIVLQRTPRFPHEKRYTINQDLYTYLDNHNRASLVLHELILREFSNQLYPHPNSINARYYNGMTLTDSFSNMTRRDYFNLLKALDVYEGDVQFEIPVIVKTAVFDNNAMTVLQASISRDHDLKWNGQVIPAKVPPFDPLFPPPTRFYPNSGFPELFWVSDRIKIQDSPFLLETDPREKDDLTRVDLNENLRSIHIYGPLTINVEKGNIDCLRSVRLSESGDFIECPAKGGRVFANGRWIKLLEQTGNGSTRASSFHPNGNPSFFPTHPDERFDFIEFKGQAEWLSFSTEGRLREAKISSGKVRYFGLSMEPLWFSGEKMTAQWKENGALTSLYPIELKSQSLEGNCYLLFNDVGQVNICQSLSTLIFNFKGENIKLMALPFPYKCLVRLSPSLQVQGAERCKSWGLFTPVNPRFSSYTLGFVLYNSGNLSKVHFSDRLDLIGRGNIKWEIPENSIVGFDEDGYVTSSCQAGQTNCSLF